MAEKPEENLSRAAAEQRAETAIEKSVAEIETPRDAKRVLDALERGAGDRTEQEVASGEVAGSPEEQAAALEHALEQGSGVRKTVAVLEETARQVAAASPADRPVLDRAIADAAGNMDEARVPPQTREGWRLLRKELFHRLKPLQAVDALLFIEINRLFHSDRLDRVMSRFSWVMNGGHAWLLIPLADVVCDPQRGSRKLLRIAVPLWLATATVEYPIKRFFRRRRPFLSIVRAVVVGRKPGSYSFPSGHSAAAFAGATLLERHYPRSARAFYCIAALVAFSRIYLGAHYPGDVVIGSMSGGFFARAYSALLRRVFSR